ncbi:DNA topoisomerase IB [Arenibaculum sp.]|uniref:DNA topoisomerase IB n=1 Tax=Arenibaculum sp. TaxID=2865862 RepID=UPI002E155DE2|nr:DNA topoisomerase IB [Arenibaculum sp.]
MPKEDAIQAVEAARLRYVDDHAPGIARRRHGQGFAYQDPRGRRVDDPATLERIAKLAIPPAWEDVWICPKANGHIQATGRDARGRKQYLYHERWREVRDAAKFERVVGFVEALPALRSQVEADLNRPGLPREKLVALVIELMERTLIRIGNRQYAEANGSYGLTTLRDRHVDVSGGRIVFNFRGKSGKPHRISVTDRRLARLVKKTQEVPGFHLFQWIDEEGRRHELESADVNAYLQRLTGETFSAKDFRTWGATVAAATGLCALPRFEKATEAKRNVNAVIKDVAQRLGNTPVLCRKCYVHPAVPATYLDGRLLDGMTECRARTAAGCPPLLEPDEAAVADYLRSLGAK